MPPITSPRFHLLRRRRLVHRRIEATEERNEPFHFCRPHEKWSNSLIEIERSPVASSIVGDDDLTQRRHAAVVQAGFSSRESHVRSAGASGFAGLGPGK